MRLVGPRRCVVWANIFRPAREGISYGGFNGGPMGRQLSATTCASWIGGRWLLPIRIGCSAMPCTFRLPAIERGRAPWREDRRCRTRLSQRGRRVLVNGDSLAFDSLSSIKRELPRRRVLDDLWFARRVAEGADVLRRFGRRLPPVIHVSLGTGDDPAKTVAFRRSLRAIMRGGCKAVLGVGEHLASGESGPGFDSINAVLADEAARRPNLRVVAWPRWLRPTRTG